jgi:hypothetical protein
MPGFSAVASLYKTNGHYMGSSDPVPDARARFRIAQQSESPRAPTSCPPCDPVCVTDDGFGWRRDCYGLSCTSDPLGGRTCSCRVVSESCGSPRFSCDRCMQDPLSGELGRLCHPVGECSPAFPGSARRPCYATFSLPCECGPCVATPSGSDRWRRQCYSEGYGWREQVCDPPPVGCGPCVSDPDNPGVPASQVCYEPGRGVFLEPCCYDPVRRSYVPCVAVPPSGPDPRA